MARWEWRVKLLVAVLAGMTAAGGADRADRGAPDASGAAADVHVRAWHRGDPHRDRQTGTDAEYHDAAAALSDPPPQTEHYLAAVPEAAARE